MVDSVTGIKQPQFHYVEFKNEVSNSSVPSSSLAEQVVSVRNTGEIPSPPTDNKDEKSIDESWVNNPERHYILQLGGWGGKKWKLFEEYAKSSMDKRQIPQGNVYGELTEHRDTKLFNAPKTNSFTHLTKRDRLDLGAIVKCGV